MEWISVKDRLPSLEGLEIKKIMVLGFFNYGNEITDIKTVYFKKRQGQEPCFENYIFSNDLTHWMPLPQPPSPDAENPISQPEPMRKGILK